MTNNLNKPSALFWVIAIAALLWNLMGAMAYLADAFMGVEAVSQLPEDQRTLYENRPAWVTASFAIAVWSGLLGSIALLLRKKWAISAFIISLIGVLAQNLYQFFLSNTFEVMGPTAMALPVMVIVISILLILYSKNALKKKLIG